MQWAFLLTKQVQDGWLLAISSIALTKMIIKTHKTTEDNISQWNTQLLLISLHGMHQPSWPKEKEKTKTSLGDIAANLEKARYTYLAHLGSQIVEHRIFFLLATDEACSYMIIHLCWSVCKVKDFPSLFFSFWKLSFWVLCLVGI